MKKSFVALLLTGHLISTSGCGVLLYPERQGQESGKIDVKVALLNGVGLFFFVIPSLVAFAIDFHQGTIYLPEDPGMSGDSSNYLLQSPSSRLGSEHTSNLVPDLSILRQGRSIQLQGDISKEAIETAIFEATGRRIDLSDTRLQVVELTQPGQSQLAYNR